MINLRSESFKSLNFFSSMRALLLFFCSFAFIINIFGQEHPSFSPSKFIFEDEQISLSFEKSYEEIITTIPDDLSRHEKDKLKKKYVQRKEYSEELLKSGLIITSGPLFDFLEGLKNQIITANPEITRDLQIYPVRNLEYNAFTTGDNIVYVNLGLLYRSENIEQVIFVICHEISHNVLDHNRKSHEITVKNIQSDSVYSILRSRARQSYGNVTAMNELMFPLLTMSRENSRKHEFEADSLGMQYYNNLNLPFSEVKASFQLMKGLDHLRDTVWLKTESQLKFLSCGHNLYDMGKYNKVSSLNITESEKDTLTSLRSHPYEDDRILFLEKNFSENSSVKVDTSRNDHWKFLAENEMIHNAFMSKNLVQTIFLILQADTNYIDESYSKDLLALSLVIFAFEKKQRKQGHYVGFINVDHDKIYKEFQSYFRELSPEECFKLAMCLKPENNKSTYSDLFQAYEFAFKKEKENFEISFDKLDLTTNQWYYNPLIEYCRLNKLKCKTK